MKKATIDTSLFDKAVKFAIKAHKNTERKGHKTPYALHVFEASSICQTITCDEEVLCAAILHDIVEDTKYTLKDIEKRFGQRVAKLVDNETDKEVSGKTKAESWKERKTYSLEKLKKSDKDSKIVAIGDKLSNIRAIYRDYMEKGEKLWELFHVKDKSEHAWYYNGLKESLKELEKENAYKEFCYLVDKVFNS